MTTKIKASNIETGAITADKLEATLDLSTKTVTLPSGGYATESYVTTQIGNVIGGAPGALDTLNELAAALGDDENFATTVTNALALKANSADVYTQSQVDTAIANNQAVTSGTTQPSSPSIGDLWYDTTAGVTSLKIYDGSDFVKVSVKFPNLTGVSGNIYSTVSTNLTLTGTNFLTSDLVVTFTAGGTNYDVVVTPTSETEATVAVPSGVYNQGSGTSVTIKVTNSDGGESGTQSKAISALPSGGTITTSGSYRIHTFNSSSSLVVPSGVSLSNVEYLVIGGGGGGGGSYNGAGGGAGGYRTSVSGQISGRGANAEPQLSLTAGTYTVTVGAGGAGGDNSNTNPASGGNSGGNSVFSSITSLGGGAGQGNGRTIAAGSSINGGSGGGGCDSNTTGGSGTTGQGYDGGGSNSGDSAGGGGGAGSAGVFANGSRVGADGGQGQTNNITGTGVYRAGGGGGSSRDTGTVGAAVHGGGRGSGNGTAPLDGTANTGGGGGGGTNYNGSPQYGKNGGSGIVIIRYAL